MTAGKAEVLIIGYGEMGHAIEFLLAQRCGITIYDPYCPPGERPEVNLERAIAGSDYVIFCTPTAPLYAIAKQVKAAIPPSAICLSMAKSLDRCGRTAPEALRHGLAGDGNCGFFYGPMIAEDILAGKLAFSTLAATDPDVIRSVMALFQGTNLKLQPFSDVTGSAWCAILKNPYAILFGIIDELQWGANVRGFVTVAALREIAAIIEKLGGETATAYGLAGLADLITTGTSRDSHHHELGRKVARGDRDALSGEGITTLDMIRTHRLISTERFPLLDSARRILREDQDIELLKDTIVRLAAE